MIDTIALSFEEGQFIINKPTLFTPSIRDAWYISKDFAYTGKSQFIKCIQNATKEELVRGIYKPKLTYMFRSGWQGISRTLRVEFSAPKLIFGNNFEELSDADYPKLKDVLCTTLEQMGVSVSLDLLDRVMVSSIHYSKNIFLKERMTCSMIMLEIGKLNLNKKLDLNKTDYRNQGHCVRYHANSYEIAFYDKIKDLKQIQLSPKRTVESDKAAQKKSFTDFSLPKETETLRMELRLNKRPKIKNLLKKLKIKNDMTFVQMFSAHIAQQMLLHFWHKIESEIDLFLLDDSKPEDVFSRLRSQPGMKPARILKTMGAMSIFNSVGLRGLISLIDGTSKHVWQKLKKDLAECPSAEKGLKRRAIEQIEKALQEFISVKLDDFDK